MAPGDYWPPRFFGPKPRWGFAQNLLGSGDEDEDAFGASAGWRGIAGRRVAQSLSSTRSRISGDDVDGLRIIKRTQPYKAKTAR